jgi:hypothetical protein
MTIPSGAVSVTKMTPAVKPMRKMVMKIALSVLSVVSRRPRQSRCHRKAGRLIFQGWRDCIAGDVAFPTKYPRISGRVIFPTAPKQPGI